MAVDLSHIRDQLLADKKQLGILVTLAVVGLLLWGRMALQDVPKTAMAEPAKTTNSKAKSAAAKRDDARREVVEIALYNAMDRNVFWVNPELYPKIEKPDKRKGDPVVTPPVNPNKPPSDEEVARARRLAVQQEAESLVLQSTILGSRPRAFINNTLLGAGETIEGFRVLKIDLRKVSLQKGDVIVVLEM